MITKLHMCDSCSSSISYNYRLQQRKYSENNEYLHYLEISTNKYFYIELLLLLSIFDCNDNNKLWVAFLLIFFQGMMNRSIFESNETSPTWAFLLKHIN